MGLGKLTSQELKTMGKGSGISADDTDGIDFAQGLDSAKGSATGTGTIYFATDTRKIYRDSGTGVWDIMSTGAGATFSTNRYVTTATTSTIPIGISGFNKATDALFVHQNGVYLHSPTDYSVDATSANLTLVSSVVTGTAFEFLAFTAISLYNANTLDGLDSTAFAKVGQANTFTGNITAPQFVSNVAQGSAPFVVTSTTMVPSLNVERLNGQVGTYYSPTTHTHAINGASITDTTITSIATNDLLQWNGTTWVNKTISGAGIAAASHSHSYLPLSGGSVTGQLTMTNHLVLDSTSAERNLKFVQSATDLGVGWYAQPTIGAGFGIYDWGNARGLLSIDRMNLSWSFTGSISASTTLTANGGNLYLRSNVSGNTSSAWAGFYDSSGTRYGFVGKGSTGDSNLHLFAERGDLSLNSSSANYNLYANGAFGSRIDVTGSTARIYNSAVGAQDYGIRINSGGGMDVLVASSVKFSVAAGGTKTGGTMDIDGVTYGMSPMDSPRVMIEDFYFDIDVKEEGTTIFLDTILSRMIEGYGVFASNGKVEVVSKDKESFTVKGHTGKVDIRVVGKRKDMLDYYYPIMNDMRE